MACKMWVLIHKFGEHLFNAVFVSPLLVVHKAVGKHSVYQTQQDGFVSFFKVLIYNILYFNFFHPQSCPVLEAVYF